MNRSHWLLLTVTAALLAVGAGLCMLRGDDTVGDPMSSGSKEQDGRWNVPTKTMGGRQFWGDVRFFHDWRIQHNVFTGHYRLLDGTDVRHAWGTRESCERRLEEIRIERQLPPMSGRAVIVVHGIVRSSKCFEPMKASLREAGYTVFGFDYPSTRVEIPEASDYLRQCVESLEGITEINFVVHSMGGLVVRAMLREGTDPRFHRMVMLGVPNRGARMANILQKNVVYRLVFGPAGQQLVEHPDGLVAQLPTPGFEFAVVAGGRGTPEGYNPLIPGDDDGTVSVESTRLAGASDFMTVRVLHSFLMRDPDVIEATERFLRTGALRESGEKQPIPKEDAEGQPHQPCTEAAPASMP